MHKKELVLLSGLVLIALGLLTGCPRRPQVKEAVLGAIGPAVPPRATMAKPEMPKPLVPPKEVQEVKAPSAEGREMEGEATPELAIVPEEEGILEAKGELPREPSIKAGEASPTPPTVREGLPSAPSTRGPEAPPREAPGIAEGEVRTPEAIASRPAGEPMPEEQPGLHEEEVPQAFPRMGEEALPLGTPGIVEEELEGPAEGAEERAPEAAMRRPVEEARLGGEPGIGEEIPPSGTPEARAEGMKAPATRPGMVGEEGRAPDVFAPSSEGIPEPSPLAEEAFPPLPLVTEKEKAEAAAETPFEATEIAKALEAPPSEESGRTPALGPPVGKPLESPGAAGGQESLEPVPSEGMAGGPERMPSSGEDASTLPSVATGPGAPETSSALARAVEPPGAGQPLSPPAGGYPEFAPPVYAPEVPQVPEPILKAEAQALLPEAPVAATAPPPTGLKERPLQDVFFDFDESLIREAARATLDQNAAWLRAHPLVKIIVEGHCDERGMNEYNLALGERRARATKEYLVAAGIDPGRVVTISYGEERPFVLGHDEEAWRWNRRSHFILLAP